MPEKQSTAKYMTVFTALLGLTVLTVFLSYHKRTALMAMVVAMMIAAVKSSLVGGFFMHLIRERPVIFWILVLTFILFISILILPVADIFTVVRQPAATFN